jgi:branched-chain amino acid transport system ATP-binding protein
VVAELAEHLRFLNRERGTAVLLVEQEVTLAFDVCPRALVLEAGRVIAAGPSAELAQSETVRKAYFGDLAVAELMTGSTDQAMTEVSR